MQLKLAFLNLPNLAQNPSPAAPSATAWQQLDEASRIAALEILARPHRPHALGQIEEGGKR
jgi:hypothetical protein